MTKPMVRIHDVATGEIIDREMTEQEYESLLADQAAYQVEKAKEGVAQAAKQAATEKLEALGLTTDDLKALGL
jgi:hypothetical protein